MSLRPLIANRQRRITGFTLVEVLVSVVLFALISSGVIYGYVVVNRMAQWSAISLAAQSLASQGAEQVRAAAWRPLDNPPTDDIPPTNIMIGGTNYILDVPIKGSPASNDFSFFVTNYISITNITGGPNLRQITSKAVWRFYVTGKIYTNTSILLRAPDQ